MANDQSYELRIDIENKVYRLLDFMSVYDVEEFLLNLIEDMKEEEESDSEGD